LTRQIAAMWVWSSGGDGEGAVTELEVLGLGKIGDDSFTDGLGFALRDVLLEVEHTTCHLSLGVGTEDGAGTSDNIPAVGVNNTIYCIVFIYDIFVNITIYVYSIFYRRPTNYYSPKSGLSALSHIRYVGRNING